MKRDFEVNRNNVTKEVENLRENIVTIQDRVEYQFFKKPTANWLLVQDMGALPTRAKFSTLAAEVSRRLRNTCEETDDDTKARILSQFSKAMQSSGYGPLARAEALWSGISGHRKIITRRNLGELQEVDRAWETRGRRQVKKLREKRTGFRREDRILIWTTTTLPQQPATTPHGGTTTPLPILLRSTPTTRTEVHL